MKRYPRTEKQIVLNAESIAEAVDVTARMYANTDMDHTSTIDWLGALFEWDASLEGECFWRCYNENISMREENE